MGAMPTIGTGASPFPSSALDNLAQVNLYSQNPNLQVTPRRRVVASTIGSNIPANSVTGATIFVTTSETFGIDEGIIFDEAYQELEDQTAPTTIATALQVLSGTMAVRFLTSGAYENVGQMTATGLFVPGVAGTRGLGLVLQYVTPQQPFFLPIRDLFLNNQTNNPQQSVPQLLSIGIAAVLNNPNAAAHGVNQLLVIKYRKVSGVGNEG